MDRIVGIGEYIISDNCEDIIKTFALASCVAVTAYSSSRKVAGMIHIVLPVPPKGMDSNARPAYYATTGIPLMLNKMHKSFGCNIQELKICLHGGANSIREDIFKIGQKNVVMISKILMEMNLVCDRYETGGTISRTLHMDVSNGRVKILTLPIKI